MENEVDLSGQLGMKSDPKIITLLNFKCALACLTSNGGESLSPS